jgi:uncharacterized protein YggT (Ycf19 family)
VDEEKSKVTETTTQTQTSTPSSAQKTTSVESSSAATPSSLTLAERIVYLIVVILETLLLFRFLLSLLGANRGNPFADFVFSVSQPFVQPFLGLFGVETAYGVSRIETETIVAALVYAVIAAIIVMVLRLPRRSSEE